MGLNATVNCGTQPSKGWAIVKHPFGIRAIRDKGKILLALGVSPAATLADIVTVPVPHLELPAGVGTLGIEFTVAVTGVLDADTQPVVVFLVCA